MKSSPFSGQSSSPLPSGITQRRKDHIVVDILTEKFPKKLSKMLDMVNHLVTMVFFAIIAWQIYSGGMKIWNPESFRRP